MENLPQSINNPPTSYQSEMISLTVRSWNVRSLCTAAKAVRIGQLANDLMFLQEIWDPKPQILSLVEGIRNMKVRSDGYGGTLVVSKLSLLQQSSEAFKLNNDSELVKYVLAGNRFIWASSVYINRKSKRNFLDLMAEVQRVVPESEWPYLLLGGDWNINLDDDRDPAREALKVVCKNMGLQIHSCGATRVENSIDFFVTGAQIYVRDSGCDHSYGLSDHAMIWIDIEISAPKVSLRKSTIPNREFADRLTVSCLTKCRSASDFLTNLKTQLKKKRHLLNKVIRKKPRDQSLLGRILKLDLDNSEDEVAKAIKDYWEEKPHECEAWLHNGRLKEAFQFLKKNYKYHEYNRRDGSEKT